MRQVRAIAGPSLPDGPAGRHQPHQHEGVRGAPGQAEVIIHYKYNLKLKRFYQVPVPQPLSQHQLCLELYGRVGARPELPRHSEPEPQRDGGPAQSGERLGVYIEDNVTMGDPR